MRKLYLFLIAALLVSGLFACKKDSKRELAAKLMGNWTLQRQNAVQYIDGVKQADTVFLASGNSSANVDFNPDGHYTSNSIFVNPGLGGGSNSSQINGTYTFDGSAFSVSAGVSGFSNFGFFAFSTTAQTTAPMVQYGAYTAHIDQLTANKLTLHTETNYTVNGENSTHAYQLIYDLYYTN